MDVMIYGCGGHMRDIWTVIHAHNQVQNLRMYDADKINITGYLLDPEYPDPQLADPRVCRDPQKFLKENPGTNILLGIGDPAKRKKMVHRIGNWIPTGMYPELIHPNAYISPDVHHWIGLYAAAGVVLNSNAVIGIHVHFHPNSYTGHDTVIRDYVSVAPGAMINGGAQIGEGADIGSGAVILPGIKVGDWAIVGAGAVVTKDVPDRATAVGVPARVIAQREVKV